MLRWVKKQVNPYTPNSGVIRRYIEELCPDIVDGIAFPLLSSNHTRWVSGTSINYTVNFIVVFVKSGFRDEKRALSNFYLSPANKSSLDRFFIQKILFLSNLTLMLNLAESHAAARRGGNVDGGPCFIVWPFHGRGRFCGAKTLTADSVALGKLLYEQ